VVDVWWLKGGWVGGSWCWPCREKEEREERESNLSLLGANEA